MKIFRKLIGASLIFLATTPLFATTNMQAVPAIGEQVIVPLNRIVAIVNNETITQTQLNQQVIFIKNNLEKSKTPLPPQAVLEQQVLSQLINRDLQLQLAKRTGIQASDMDVNDAIKKIAMQNHQTVAEAYRSTANLGLNRQQFRQNVRNELIMNKLQSREIAAKITITPQEVDDYLRTSAGQALDTTEYHLGTILVNLPSAPSAKQIALAKLRAEVIVKELKKGANFKLTAVSKSKGQNALRGGDFGWRQLLQMPTAFAANVIHLKVNEVAGPIRTPNGFYIIKLLGTRAAAKTPQLSNEALKQKIENLIFQRKFHERLVTWIEQLRASAYVKILLKN